MQSKDYYQTTLKEHPHLLKETLELIEESFQYIPNFKFQNDFFPLINKQNFPNNHILVEKTSGKVVSHIGVKKRWLGKKDQFSPIHLIGGIATHKKYRGKGLFKFFFQEIINKSQENCALFILWSDKSKLYEKFNFYPAGEIIQTGLQQFKDQHGLIKTKFSKLSFEEWKEIKEIYKKNHLKDYLSLKREKEDWAEIEKISSTDLFLKKDEEGKIQFYFCINKGMDLSDIIHEVGHRNGMHQENLEPLMPYKMWVPPTKVETGPEIMGLPLGYFRIGDKKFFQQFLDQCFQNQFQIESIKNGKVSFFYNGQGFELSQKKFLPLLFGPNSTWNEKEELFPQSPMYISGLDSI